MLYVTDDGNNRVQKFSTAGKYEAKFGEGKLSRPYGLAADPVTGNLYVGDYANTRVQEFSAAGTLITKFGSSGSGAGQFTGPTGVAVSSGGGVYVVDYGSNRVEEWTHPSWLPTLADGPLSSDTTTYAYEAVEAEEKTVIEPTEALAPPPSGVSCGTKPSELKRGCRALTFKYATATTATGENRSEWNDYKGRLSQIVFHAYNRTSKAMEEVAVAQYAYDKQGRLRAEWDPRISPALKTTYGYDSEGRLTALTPPGQGSWALIYGSTSGDASTGRLLKATRSAPLWNGELPKNTEAPKLTGAAVVGVSMGVSHGAWSNNPIVYGYQWEDCNSTGGECAPIAGATNANYKVSSGDVGHVLAAVISAANGGGSVASTVATSGLVSAAAGEYALPAGSHPLGIANGPAASAWLTEVFMGKVAKITSSGAITEYKLTSEALSPTAITSGPEGNLWLTDWIEGSTSKIAKLTPSGTVSEYALPNNSHPEGITTGPDGKLWYTDYHTSKIGKINPASGNYNEYALPAGSEPLYITTGSDEKLWFTEYGTNKIGEISTTGTITEYALPAGSRPVGITKGSDNNVWFTERGTNKIGKITTSGTITEYAVGSGAGPMGIAPGPDGNLWYTTHTTSKVGKITTSGASTEYSIPTNSEPAGITTGPDGNLWYVDQLTSKVAEIPTAGTTPSEGEPHGPEPGTTVEYHVPLSGTGLPTLTKSEVEKWKQKDDPSEGMAVLPPDEPQGWPASSYKRATIDYLDEVGRTVNVSTPNGGISTSEYNEVNELTRTLSADDRAAALKEGAKSGEASEKLDTKTTYDPTGSEIVKVVGPEHAVKLSTGAEVQARSVTRNFYDEGAPGGQIYGLLTKTTVGAEYAGKEADVRTTLKSYSGQENLGWKLRQPTSTTTDPAGLDLVHKTVFDPSTGNVTETRSPGANSETIYPPAFASSFGSEGAGNGQFKRPQGVATDASASVWVADKNNGRIEKFSASGTFIAAYGSKGSGNGQFNGPWGIAINQSTGNVYVADTENNRIVELSSSGAFIANFGTTGAGTLKEPIGVTIDPGGGVWVTDWAHNRVVKFSAEGAFVGEMGSLGSGSGQFNGPTGIAISEGSIFVVDAGNSRIQRFSLSSGVYEGQFASKGTGAGQLESPSAIAANPTTGNLYVTDTYNYRVQEFSPAGRFLTSWGTWGPTHALSYPTGVAIASNGTLYLSDQSANKVSSWTPPEAGAAHLSYGSQFGSSGSGSGQFSTPIASAIDGQGYIWVSDYGNNRIEKFSPKGSFIASYGSAGSGNGQFSGPGGIDINQSTGDVYISDAGNHRIEQLSSTGTFIRTFGTSGAGELTRPGGLKIDSAGNVWVPDMSANKIVKFSSTGAFIATYGKEGSGEVQFKQPTAIAFSGENLYVSDTGNHRIQELSKTATFIRQWGIEGEGSGELYAPEGIAADAAGHLYVVDNGASHVEEFNPNGGYLASFATKGSGEGQLKAPIGDSIDAAGDMYVVDSENNRVEKWTAANQAVHDTKTIYYSALSNSEYPQCGEHPEWANMPCQVEPVAQPSDAPPSLPISTTTYNFWDESDVKTEKMGSTTRTTTATYDAAGRALTSEETSTAGAPLPKVTNEFSETTGALIKQSTTTEGTTKTITSAFNTLGQLTSYTDADGNLSKYTYDIDGRVEELSDGKGSQIYVHDPTTGLLSELFDSAAGSFKATYDAEGKLLSQSYPNGMTATYKLNSVGQATQVEYIKTTHCSSSCTLFSDTIVPSIHGEALSQSSTLSSESYNYDSVGRLTKTQETPAGKGCTTRVYSYDEESNRTNLTTREPAAEGKCAEEGGTSERHIYDEANRLVDAGTSYDALGNATSLPAADAGGHELTDTYYVDNQVHAQTQNGETISYAYDPAGRTREAVSTGKTSATAISHYAGPGQALTWTSEGSETWSRNIPGIDGALDAIQASGGTPVLQVHDLQGNIVGTAALSETETKLLSTYNSTEFGVPQPGTTPPKYAWLGAEGVSSEPALSSGVSAQSGAAYVPQLARELQTMPVVPPGAFPNGQGTGSPYTSEIPGWDIKLSEEQSAATLAEYLAQQEALRRQAEEQAGGYEWGGDPPEEAIYFTLPEAELWYAISKANDTFDIVYELGKFLKHTLARGIIEWAEGLVGLHDPEEWVNAISDGLHACTEVGNFFLEGDTAARCRIGIPMVTVFEINILGTVFAKTEIPDFRQLPNVSLCAYYGHECILT